MRFLFLCACSAGIASTYMAAEALELEAKRRGHWAKAETQGTIGIENEISIEDALRCDAVIVAADIKVQNMGRFAGNRVFRFGVAEAIRHADRILDEVERRLIEE